MTETNMQRAERALSRCGRSPLVLRGMNETEVLRVSSLANLPGDIREKLRLILVEHYEARKATDEETDTFTTLTEE